MNLEKYILIHLLTSDLGLDLNLPVDNLLLKPSHRQQIPLFRELLSTLASVGLWIFILVVIADGLDQWLTNKMQALLNSSQGTDSRIWLYGLISIAVSVVFPVIALILISTGSLKLRQFNEVCIETLRTWGRSLSWSFLFIIPGFMQWLSCAFVPFIVLELPAYHQGQVDALDCSQEFTRGKRLKILGLVLLFSILLPLLLTNWDEYRDIRQTPASSLFISFLESLFMILFLLLLRRLFRKAKQMADLCAIKENS